MGEPRGCYAEALGNCEGPLTHEHHLSRSVLEIFGQFGVSGTSWIPDGEVKRLSINAAAAKTLCEKHNSSLSDLDAAIAPLFRRIAELIDAPTLEVFSSISNMAYPAAILQRWLLKAFCGDLASGWIQDGDRILQAPDILLEWLEIEFAHRQWPMGTGLFSEYRTLEFDQGHFFKSQVPIGEGDAVYCYRVWIFGIPFFLSLVPINDVGGDLARPSGVRIIRWGVVKEISFEWQLVDDSFKWLGIIVP